MRNQQKHACAAFGCPHSAHRAWISTYICRRGGPSTASHALLPSPQSMDPRLHPVCHVPHQPRHEGMCPVRYFSRAILTLIQAVLLLRPNVSLYSSDALPLNCSAHTAGPESTRAAASHKSNPSTAPARTCECLTQSLSCHGCGSTIGYMIVNPVCTPSSACALRCLSRHLVF